MTIPFPATPSDEVEQATLHELVDQYLTLVVHNPASLQNKVLLIDDDTGQVIGEVDAAGLTDSTKDGASGPVVVDLGGDGRMGVVVTEVPAGELENDWLLRGASQMRSVSVSPFC